METPIAEIIKTFIEFNWLNTITAAQLLQYILNAAVVVLLLRRTRKLFQIAVGTFIQTLHAIVGDLAPEAFNVAGAGGMNSRTIEMTTTGLPVVNNHNGQAVQT